MKSSDDHVVKQIRQIDFAISLNIHVYLMNFAENMNNNAQQDFDQVKGVAKKGGSSPLDRMLPRTAKN